MKEYEKAAHKFLKKYKNKKSYLGAVLCGSYVMGNETKYSDVDLHIIMDDTFDHRERGNKVIDGLIIDYFINPVKRFEKYIEADRNLRVKYVSHMFKTGKIIDDTDKKVYHLKKELEKEFKKRFPPLKKAEIEGYKYFMMDSYKNLKEKAKDFDFLFVYYHYLNYVRESYLKYLRVEVGAIRNAASYIYDKKKREKYLVEDIKDKKFKTLFKKCLKQEDSNKMLENIKKLRDHVVKEMGGINMESFHMKYEL